MRVEFSYPPLALRVRVWPNHPTPELPQWNAVHDERVKYYTTEVALRGVCLHVDNNLPANITQRAWAFGTVSVMAEPPANAKLLGWCKARRVFLLDGEPVEATRTFARAWCLQDYRMLVVD